MIVASWCFMTLAVAIVAADEIRGRRRRAMSDASNVRSVAATPRQPPVVLTLANGGIAPAWTRDDEAGWTADDCRRTQGAEA